MHPASHRDSVSWCLSGVKTKGHSEEEAWIKTYTVAYSTDGASWTDVSGTLTGNTDQNTEVEAMLPSVVTARWWLLGGKEGELV